MGTPENWAEPVLRRGLDQVFDLADKQRGAVLDFETGALMIDGWPCLPWTPKHLHKIDRPPRFALGKEPSPRAKAELERQSEHDLAKLREFQAAQAELAHYTLSSNGRRNAKGSRHFHTTDYRSETATAVQRSAGPRSSVRRRSRSPPR